MVSDWLTEFIKESNKIEGIVRDATQDELEAHTRLLSLPGIEVPDLEQFVRTATGSPQGGYEIGRLRSQPGLDVMVGGRLCPKGGPKIVQDLLMILTIINGGGDPYDTHKMYERLHPFTDGNGRSGRALWLWGMQKTGQIGMPKQLGFLHSWYYQSLRY